MPFILCFSSHYYHFFLINYFSGITFSFIDSNSLRMVWFCHWCCFSGVVGVGLHPMGNRVWCRLMSHGSYIGTAAYHQNLELPSTEVNVFCGNCSTYCEIPNVRSYALARKQCRSCVGCGILCGCLP
jgi:hypothetical protein